MKDIIIVGGGCAGLTAALYAARAGKSVLVFEAENIGGQITATPQVDNYPGIRHVSGMQFADNLYEQVIALGVEVELETVVRIEHSPEYQTVITESGSHKCKSVILATGAKHRSLGLPGEKELIGHGVSYCAMCDGAFYKNSPVIVVGGGNTAITDALFLASYCESVTVIHRRETFRADENLLTKAKEKKNIHWITNSVVEELVGKGNLSGVRVRNKITGEFNEIPVEAVFIAIGQVPENAAFANLLATDTEGYLMAGEDCSTALPGIYVAGDCRAKAIRQLTTAVADGTNAAMAAWKHG
jgi:thioredoxin reductase (NADPH)